MVVEESGFALNGEAGDDFIFGNQGVNWLIGGEGDDRIFGGDGDDGLGGDVGNDTLAGGAGSDTYYFDAAEFGHDVIDENQSRERPVSEYNVPWELDDGAIDKIRFSCAPADIALQRSGLDLVLTHKLTGSTVTASNYFLYAGNPTGQVELVEFDGGTIWDRATVEQMMSTVFGTAGNDSLSALADVGSTVYGLAGNDTIAGLGMDDQLYGGEGADQLSDIGGNNLLDGGPGADSMTGGVGNDIFIVDQTGDTVSESAAGGFDTIQTSVTMLAALPANVEAVTLTGISAINATGNSLANRMTGNAAANSLNGGAGNDTMAGGAGDDLYTVNSTMDEVEENGDEGTDTVSSTATFTLSDHVENLTLTGSSNISATGNGLNNVLAGNSGTNTLTGKGGDDNYVVTASDIVVEAVNEGIDTVTSSVSLTADLAANVENLTLTGSNAINGVGNGLDNVITGNSANNALTGRGGNDTYHVTAGDTVTEAAGGGTDTVVTLTTMTNPLANNVENLTLAGTAAINGTGNASNNTITGNGNANAINGGGGADIMVGGGGNDTYTVDNTGDSIVEAVGEGIDSVSSSVTHTLSDNVENLTLTLTGNVDATGNALDNVLTGNSGTNRLTGKAGNDTYFVTANDVVVEDANNGTDTIHTGVALAGDLATNVENLTLTGTSAINGTGNALDNVLTGNSGNNVLTGKLGNDTYVVTAGDTVTEQANQGTDTVMTGVALSGDLAANVENLTLTGTSAINGRGNSLANVITGNSATNTLIGLGGNDTYVVGSNDIVQEAAGGGTDTIQTDITWNTLAAEVENLTLTGTAAIDGSGNSLNNTLRGNGAANALNGGTGNDTMIGGAGDDFYTVDSASDVVTELAGEGADTILTGITLTADLAANVENLTLTGTNALNGNGNALDNVLTGNSAINTLTGKAGNDTYIVTAGDVVVEAANEGVDTVSTNVALSGDLSNHVENITLTGSSAIGGRGNGLDNVLTGNSAVNTLVGLGGNDTYVVSDGDIVQEASGGGVDTVRSSITWNGLAAEVENLTLTGSNAIDGSGNAAANTLTGNGAANTLDGAGGADTLIGAAGDDTYIVDSTTDIVTEAAGEGVDTIRSSVTLSVLAANVENVTLTGSSAVDAAGNALGNTLTGNAGVNVLRGAGGDDTYVVGANDTVVELAGEGVDTVHSSADATLGAHVENLVLLDGAVNGTGNSLNNILTGNAAANVLAGGGGNDIYLVGTGDVVVEDWNQGWDEVQSSISWSLEGSEVEWLRLTGSGDVNGTGNDGSNFVWGNSGANTLLGGGGMDQLEGNAGTDTLDGGQGRDFYIMRVGDGVDTVQDSGTDNEEDSLEFEGVGTDQLWFARAGDNLEVSIIGRADKAVMSGWFAQEDRGLEAFRADGFALAESDVQALVDAMAAFAPPAPGQTTLPPNYSTALAPLIATSWRSLA